MFDSNPLPRSISEFPFENNRIRPNILSRYSDWKRPTSPFKRNSSQTLITKQKLTSPILPPPPPLPVERLWLRVPRTGIKVTLHSHHSWSLLRSLSQWAQEKMPGCMWTFASGQGGRAGWQASARQVAPQTSVIPPVILSVLLPLGSR